MNGKTVPLLTWFSPTALLPLIQLLQSRWLRGLIYTYAKQQAPWHRKKQLQKEEKKLHISDSKATRSSQAKNIGTAMAFCTHLHMRFSILVKTKGVKKPAREKSMLCCCALRCLNGLTVWGYECAIEVIKVSIQCHCIVLLYSHNDSRVQWPLFSRQLWARKLPAQG